MSEHYASCSNCRYFWQPDQVDPRFRKAQLVPNDFGVCRESSPCSDKFSNWAETHPNWWCGEHAMRKLESAHPEPRPGDE